MRKTTFVLLLAVGVMVTLLAPGVLADTGSTSFSARLIGYEETPAISTTGRGSFFVTRASSTTFRYRLTYTTEATSGGVLFAHIHFGQRNVAGGVAVFLCGGGTKPDPCPSPGGTVTGTITRDDVIGPNVQGIEPRALDELLRAMRAGVTYANVHTTRFPSGEIRGQLRAGDDDND